MQAASFCDFHAKLHPANNARAPKSTWPCCRQTVEVDRESGLGAEGVTPPISTVVPKIAPFLRLKMGAHSSPDRVGRQELVNDAE